MKTIVLVLLLFLVSCKTMQNTSETLKKIVTVTAENCPENGKCIIELLPNSSLEFKKDSFGNEFPVLSTGNLIIFRYTFEKDKLSNVQDSNYTEIIYAELTNPITKTTLVNEDLQKVKLHFGRLCYCKGETGFYPIKSGLFQLEKTSNDSLKITIDFKQKATPQLISIIKQTISLKSTTTN